MREVIKMSRFSKYRANLKKRNRIAEFLKDKGDPDIMKYDIIAYTEGLLIIGYLSFLLPIVSMNLEFSEVFEAYPDIKTMFFAYSIILVAGLFGLEWISIQLDKKVDKKIDEYLKEAENGR